ncbi:uncharacterized protein LY79DRAFT_662669 [Colletotrichum navitas]|uniref:Heterokaryon incompatibility domain-containing protein n=1 Tax=Colletotrichum navitas TaxID=681940 RepID=A0AAD8PPN7_9PEZI|nr:uncharacterized protein LY79DRAFT_662669 [Colletotrichum navitas]KAK1573663.1 hypothetical protein LY79DRAFT_662669 [Colletotrichum navitas]
MGITLLEIESKKFKEFGQWNTTPPYAAIAFLGHLDLDLGSRNDTGHSQWMSEKPQLWQLDVACDLVRDRGLRYLWPDYCCPVMESSRLASSRLEHLEACYERACWCLVFTPKSLYQHFHWHLDPDGQISGWPQPATQRTAGGATNKRQNFVTDDHIRCQYDYNIFTAA